MKNDRLKKAKDFLRNVMIIHESKMKMSQIISGYSSENDLTKKALEALITEVKIIISCNKKNKTSSVADVNFLGELEKLLKKKIKELS